MLLKYESVELNIVWNPRNFSCYMKEALHVFIYMYIHHHVYDIDNT